MSDVLRPFADMPEVPPELWDQARKLFSDYLFVKPRIKSNDREAICSFCGKRMFFKPFMAPGYSYDPSLFYLKQGDVIECPSCSRRVTVKDYSRSRWNLNQRQYVVFVLPVSFDKVFVRSYSLRLRFCEQSCDPKKDIFYDHPPIEPYQVDRYVLEKGSAIQERYQYGYSRGWTPVYPYKDAFADDCGLYHCRENYMVFCASPIENTFLKYSCYDRFRYGRGYYEKFRYLCWYAQYPMIEYLVKSEKFDGRGLVNDLIYGSPNKRILNWEADSPKDVFKLTPEEMRLWIANGGGLESLKVVMSLGRPTADNWLLKSYFAQSKHKFDYAERRRLVKYCKRYGIDPLKLLRYLIRVEKENPGCHHCPAPDVFITWDDYISNAIVLEYDLKDPVVFMPKNLFEAHDVAFRTDEAVRIEKESKQMATLTKRLQKKYAYSNETFTIVVPTSMQEIIREGKVMHHCVGGYAERHAKGQTVILFLRQNFALGVPFVTIEMNGLGLRQAQAKGNTSPSKEARAFINEWIAWLSKADKKKPKKEKEVKIA